MHTGMIVSLLISAFCALQALPTQAEKLVFESITTRDGLSSRDVRCITQDKHGMMWIGTDEGLNRYDGNRFTAYKHDNEIEGSLSSSWINCLYSDASGNIWIGTEKGLAIFDTDTGDLHLCNPPYDTGNLLSSHRIGCIFEDSDSVFWIGTHTGLIKYDYRHSGIEFFNVAKKRGNIFLQGITDIIEDSNGSLWLGSNDGLYRYDRSDNSYDWFKLDSRVSEQKNTYVECVKYLREKEVLYVGTSAGLFIIDLEGNVLDTYNTSNSGICGNDVCSIASYTHGRFLLGTSQGLSIFEPETGCFQSYFSNGEPTSLLNNYVRTLYEDTNGVIWMGTRLGVSKLDTNRKAIDLFPTKFNGDLYLLNDIERLDENLFWIATNDGIIECDHDFQFIRHYSQKNGLGHRIVKRLLPDSHGTVWAGTDNGLQAFDRRTKQFRNVSPDGTSLKYIFDIKETASGEIIVNAMAGLCIISPQRDGNGTMTGYSSSTLDLSGLLSQEGSSIPYFTTDRDGNIWIGTINDGVIKYNPADGLKSFSEEDGLSSNRVYSLFADSRGTVWVGTDCGLNSISGEGNVTRHRDISESVRIITEDEDGIIWIGLPHSIVMYNSLRGEKVICELQDILGAKEITYNASFIHDGHIYMGGDECIIRFNPKDIHVNRNAPGVVFSSFDILGSGADLTSEYVTGKKSVTLGHGQDNIRIWFAMPSYFNSRNNAYEYFLDGFDSERHWTYGENNSASYANLKPGNYVFKVRGFNPDGVESSQPAELHINIKSPWWLSTNAIIFYILLVVAALWTLIRSISKRNETSRQLEKERKDRVRMEELNAMKTEFFANISHEFKTPLSLIMAPTESLLSKVKDENDRKNLDIIKQNSIRLKELIGQIMDLGKLESGIVSLDLSTGDIVLFIEHLVQQFRPKTDKRGISLIFRSEIDRLVMNFDSKKVEKILFNLLGNAYKYTPEEGTIVVGLHTEEMHPGKMYLTVSDNGCGILKEDIPHLFDRYFQGHGEIQAHDALRGTGIGLLLVKEYADLHEGDVRVESEPGKGATFTVTLSTSLGEELSEDDEAEGSEHCTGMNRKRIVIIEDDKDMLSFLRMNFDQTMDVYTAEDGQKGLSLIRETTPDIIISDLMLRGMDGIDVCNAVRKDSITAHIPFIILTANADSEVERKSYDAGADVFLTKPFSVKTLMSSVKSIMESRDALKKKYRRQLLETPSEVSIESIDDKLLKRLVQIIEENISDPDFGVPQLCEQVNYPHQQIYRKVKAMTGESVSSLIRNVRLARAAQLLTGSDLRISEIQYQVGFSSHSYFTKCFKQHYGCSPTQFAEKAGKTVTDDNI